MATTVCCLTLVLIRLIAKLIGIHQVIQVRIQRWVLYRIDRSEPFTESASCTNSENAASPKVNNVRSEGFLECTYLNEQRSQSNLVVSSKDSNPLYFQLFANIEQSKRMFCDVKSQNNKQTMFEVSEFMYPSLSLNDQDELCRSNSDDIFIVFPLRPEGYDGTSTGSEREDGDENEQVAESEQDSQTKEQSGDVAQTKEQSGDVAQTKEQSGDVAQTKEQSGDVAQTKEQSGDIAQTKEQSRDDAQIKVKEQSGDVSQSQKQSGDVKTHKKVTDSKQPEPRLNPNPEILRSHADARIKHPGYEHIMTRLRTIDRFSRPLNRTTRIQMARAGFFYTGHVNIATCFCCGGQIINPKESDDPWMEHARLFPNCPHVIQNNGQAFDQMGAARATDSRQNGHPEEERILMMENNVENSDPQSETLNRPRDSPAGQASSQDRPVLGAEGGDGWDDHPIPYGICVEERSRVYLSRSVYLEIRPVLPRSRITNSPDNVRNPVISNRNTEQIGLQRTVYAPRTTGNLRTGNTEEIYQWYRICVVCHERRVSVELDPCGHGCCRPCAQNETSCRVCNRHITGFRNI